MLLNANLNLPVKARLTVDGRDHFIDQYYGVMEVNYDEETAILRCQLWELMHIFGDKCNIGSPPMSQENMFEIQFKGV
jgi:hypothetical protein